MYTRVRIDEFSIYIRAAAADVGRNCRSICLALSLLYTSNRKKRENLDREEARTSEGDTNQSCQRVRLQAKMCPAHIVATWLHYIDELDRIVCGSCGEMVQKDRHRGIQLSRRKSLAISHIFKRRATFFPSNLVVSAYNAAGNIFQSKNKNRISIYFYYFFKTKLKTFF
jgi:hypothetical protein